MRAVWTPLWITFWIFLTLKLLGAIGWSWWWVTAPLWAPVALIVALWALANLALFFINVGEIVAYSWRLRSLGKGYAKWRAREKLRRDLDRLSGALRAYGKAVGR
jgi:hypothetical protein